MLYNKSNLWVLYCVDFNLIKKSDNIKYKTLVIKISKIHYLKQEIKIR